MFSQNAIVELSDNGVDLERTSSVPFIRSLFPATWATSLGRIASARGDKLKGTVVVHPYDPRSPRSFSAPFGASDYFLIFRDVRAIWR